MRPTGLRAVIVATLFASCVASTIVYSAQTASSAVSAAIEADFAAFWNADNPKDASRAADRLIKDGVDFDTAWVRLKKGRAYKKAPTGIRTERLSADGTIFQNLIEIPPDYDPSRAWPVRVQLHGGIGRPEPQDPQRRRENRIAGEPQIYVFPTGWADAQWWNANQVDNILALVDRVKRVYNVDESYVYLTGISDGGTGVYFFAMREATVWSSCLPLNGNIRVLANRNAGADGEMFLGNLVNRPLFVVNGGRDPLYPVEYIAPTIDAMRQIGAPLVFHPQMDAGHDTSWWPAEQKAYEEFVRAHPRAPHPDQLSWETERTDRYNRIQWLVIDALGSTPSDSTFDSDPLFPHRRSSGRVDLTRNGNTIDVRTRGVRAFTLLMSPDAVDFGSPLEVIVNGRPAYEGSVAKNVATLLKWAARDNDRTMLYGAEVKVTVQ